MRDGTERAGSTGDLFMWIQWIGGECVAPTECPGKRPSHSPGVLGIEIEIEEAEWFVRCQWKSLGCGGCDSIDELLQCRVRHGRNCALSEIIVIQTKDAGVRAKPQFVSAPAPSEIVIDEEARGSPALYPSVVEPSNRSERRICAATLQHNRECRECLLKVTRPKQTRIPGKRGIEVVHQILRKDVRVSRRKGIERLRGKSVEQGDDGIGISGLESVVGLKAEPGSVFLIDVVIDPSGLYLFMVIAGVRNAVPVRATVTIRWTARSRSAVRIERTPEHRE